MKTAGWTAFDERVDLRKFNSGIYFLSIDAGGQITTKRVVNK